MRCFEGLHALAVLAAHFKSISVRLETQMLINAVRYVTDRVAHENYLAVTVTCDVVDGAQHQATMMAIQPQGWLVQ